MKLIIAGGRDYILNEVDFVALDELHKRTPVTVVLSGCAMGADQGGERWALSRGIVCIRYPALWETYGKKAGFMRNEEMAAHADALFAFPGGKGTADMVRRAKEHGLKVSMKLAPLP